MCRQIFTVAPLVLILLGAPHPARACTCSQAPPGTCPGLQQGDVVFLGTVTSVDSPAPADPSAAAAAQSGQAQNSAAADASGNTNTFTPITRYHFHVDEGFAGPGQQDIDILSGGDDGDCGYSFKQGEQYIVFTQQELGGQLFATLCNGTRPASGARALIPQLRAMRNGQRVASVFGVLRRSDPPFLAPADDPDDPLPNISLRLRSQYDRFSTSTGPDGIYTFYDVHAGEYSFTANLPVRMELTQKTLTGGLPPFKIPNGACYEYDVDALPTGHIRGSVVGPDSKPLKIASVELYRAGQYADTRPGLWAFQGFRGYFDFDHIGPGNYILVYNRIDRKDPNSPYSRSFYPGTPDASHATPITLRDGQGLKLTLRVRDGYPTRRLKVHVKWEDGKPPGNLTVMAKADDGTANPAADKIADGVFEFPLLESIRYTVSAWEDLDPQPSAGRNACTIPARIEANPVAVDGSDEDTKDVTLVFAGVKCTKEETPASSQAN